MKDFFKQPFASDGKNNRYKNQGKRLPTKEPYGGQRGRKQGDHHVQHQIPGGDTLIAKKRRG